jgi:hypothetical protein
MDAVDVPSGPGRAPGAVADSAPGRQRGVWRRYTPRLALLLPAAVLAAAIGHAVSHVTHLYGAAEKGRLAATVVAALAFTCLGTLIALLPRVFVVWLGAALVAVLGGALVIDRQFPAASLPRGVVFSGAVLSLALLVLLALVVRRAAAMLWRARRARPVDLWPAAGLGLGLLLVTAAYVLASRRILFWDPIVYWTMTDRIADLVRAGQWTTMAKQLVISAGDEYSLIPAVLPGMLTAPASDQNLLAYMLAVATCYVLPCLIGIGVLGFALASSAVPDLADLPWPKRLALTVVGGLSSVALLPHFLEIFLRNVMLDSGGVVLIVALAFAWHRLILVVLAPLAPDRARCIALVLAAAASVGGLSLTAFIFRRWYVFDVLGLAVVSVVWLLTGLLRAWPHHREVLARLLIAGATAVLTGLVLGPTVIGQWVAQWGHRNYAESYAAYWVDWATMLAGVKGYCGYAVPVALGVFAAVLLWRGQTPALLARLILATALAVVGLQQVQGASTQHYYLVMPLLGGLAAAAAILAARRLGALVVLPVLAATLWFLGFAPRHAHPAVAALQPRWVDLRPEWNSDATILAHLGQWLDANLVPGSHYCVAASGVAVNSGVISNLWQIDSALRGTAIVSAVVDLPQVDSRDGPPDDRLQSCNIMITAEPPQTHLRPHDQQSILLVLEDVAHRRGVGQAFAPAGATFRLPSGTVLTAYRMTRPISPQEMQDIRSRFYTMKGAQGTRYQQRFGPP